MWGSSYDRAKGTGYNDGTMGGMLGAVDHNRQKQEREAASNAAVHDEAERRRKARKSAKDDDNAKVICTELHRQGLMSRADYALGADYARKHLTERHYHGYHAWALAVVRHMRRSKRATAFWRILAQARADHIAYLYGDTARRNSFGALLCAVGYPACYLIGGLISERDWQALYRGSKTDHA
ncbi:hypothetical protein [Shinella sp.]|uniref:hypothetical protein n=1 Tax=Shinella sp. TaxID=1870904 RepID=UPI003F6EC980